MTSDFSQTAEDRNPVDVLADEFASRLRNGESPSMQEYIDRYPEHASEIEELFPGVALLEQLSQKQESEASNRQRPRQHALPPGHRFGDIEIICELGRGGMGIVYQAYQHSLSRAVAVKAIHSGSVHSPNQAARFQREAQAAAQLHHTNIVPVFGVGEQDGISYYVMQLIHGQGLDAVLTELAQKVRGLHGVLPGRSAAGVGNAAAVAGDSSSVGSFSARQLADVLVSGKLSESTMRPGSGSLSHRYRDPDPTVRVPRSRPEAWTEPADAGCSDSASALEYRLEDRTEDRTAELAASETPVQEVRSSFELRDETALPSGVGSSLVLRDGSFSRAMPVDSAPPGRRAAEEGTDPALQQLGTGYWRNIARIGVQIASGLQYAHAQGTLHRDIKPANILLDTEGTAWIADFGLAKVLQQEDVTRTGDVVGTLRYMAPEQFRGETDGRSDLYSLGLTLYELLTLRPAYEETDRQQLIARKLTPHDPPHPRRLHPGIPRDLETIVLKCLAWEPDGRYPTAGALVADLQAFLDDRPIQARRISSAERFWRWCRRNPVVAGLSTAVAVLLMAHATLATFGYFQEKERAEKMAALSALAESRREAAEQSAFEAEQLADVQWDALNRIYETFVPERFAAPVEASADAESDDESGLETASTAPVLSTQTAAMLEEMLVSFERIASIRGTDERYLEETARANRKVGDLHLRLGQYEEAADAFERAIARYQQLQEVRGSDPATLVHIARLHNGLGITWQHRWDLSKARDALGSSLAILHSPRLDESDPAVRHETAWTHYLLGRRPPRGAPPRRSPDRDSADRRNDSSRPTVDEPTVAGTEQETQADDVGTAAAPSDPPDTEDRQADRPSDARISGGGSRSGALSGPPAPPMPVGPTAAADRDDRLGRRSGQRGERGRGEDRRGGRDSRENFRHLQTAIAILEPLIEEHSDVPEYRFLHALCHIELSNPRVLPAGTSGDENLDQAIEILSELVREHPDEPDYLYQLSEAHEQRFYRWKRDFRPLFLQEYAQRIGPWDRPTDLTEIDAAEVDLQEAVRLSTDLMRQQPNVARYAESHQSLLFNLADVEVVQGDTEQALRLLDEAEQLAQMIQTRFPQATSTFWIRPVRQDMLRAEALLQASREKEAVGVLQDVLQQIPPSDGPDGRGFFDIFRREMEATVYSMLAAAHDQLGDSSAAQQARRQARALRHNPRDRSDDSFTGSERGATN